MTQSYHVDSNLHLDQPADGQPTIKSEAMLIAHADRYPYQLELFEGLLPVKPYSTDDLASGVRILPKKMAIAKKYVQPNGPTHKYFLVLDVDREAAAIDWRELNAPPPNFTAMNPLNGHAHLFYVLDVPVRTAYGANIKPLKYLAAIERGLVEKLGADKRYVGFLSKNPIHPHWRVIEWVSSSYSLGELADWVDLNLVPSANDDVFGLGRNCSLFHDLRHWAYKAIRQGWPEYKRWCAAVEDRALMYNIQFTTPLDRREVRSIAKSVAKWTYNHFSEAGFKEWQSRQGKRSGEARRRGKLLENNRTPWIDEGISRSTWYRRQRR